MCSPFTKSQSDIDQAVEEATATLRNRVRKLENKYEKGGCGYISGIPDPENRCKHVLWAKQRKQEIEILEEALEKIKKLTKDGENTLFKNMVLVHDIAKEALRSTF